MPGKSINGWSRCGCKGTWKTEICWGYDGAFPGPSGPLSAKNDPQDHFSRAPSPHTPPGCRLHPGPRQWRMLLDFYNQQLSAAAWITQSPASGQPASLARCAARRTAKTGVRPEKMSKLIFPDCRRFSYARKLSLRRSSFTRGLFVVVFKPVRPLGCKG